jgi:hypothetical protein
MSAAGDQWNLPIQSCAHFCSRIVLMYIILFFSQSANGKRQSVVTRRLPVWQRRRWIDQHLTTYWRKSGLSSRLDVLYFALVLMEIQQQTMREFTASLSLTGGRRRFLDTVRPSQRNLLTNKRCWVAAKSLPPVGGSRTKHMWRPLGPHKHLPHPTDAIKIERRCRSVNLTFILTVLDQLTPQVLSERRAVRVNS